MTAAGLRPVPHPGVDLFDTAEAVLAVAAMGTVPIVTVPAAALGDCLACEPLSAAGPNPAVVVLCHREVDDDTSWIHRWVLCEPHLVREARPVVAKHVPVWVEAPRVVLA